MLLLIFIVSVCCQVAWLWLVVVNRCYHWLLLRFGGRWLLVVVVINGCWWLLIVVVVVINGC